MEEYGFVEDIMAFSRDLSVDRFRGLAVLAMIILQIWRDFRNLEVLSKLGNHSASAGLTIIDGMQFIDIIAPMFLLSIAFTYKGSFDRRCLKYGQKKTIMHFLKRYILLIGLGGILRTVESFVFFASHGYVEKPIDYLFFVCLLFLVIFLIGKVFVIVFKNKKMDRVLSRLIIILTSCIAVLCLFATTRDFFVQILNKDFSNFRVWGYWETLQAIGASGLITLLFIRHKTSKRFSIATIIFIGYFIFHETGNHKEIISVYAQQGGFFGILGQSCIVLYCTVLADLYYKDRTKLTRYLIALPCFGVAALIILQFVEPTMRSVSPSYILINIFISGTIFLIIKLYDFLSFKIDLLKLLGQNSLLMYMLQYVLIYGTKEIIGYDFLNKASDLFAMSFTIIMVSILTIVAYWMDKTGKILKL